MSVNRCGGDIFMSEEFLDCPDVVACFKQMRGKAVSESMTAGGLAQASCADREFNRVLEILFRNVMTARLAARGSTLSFAAGQTYCHGQERTALTYFRSRGVTQINGTTAAGDILAMQFTYARKMLLERS